MISDSRVWTTALLALGSLFWTEQASAATILSSNISNVTTDIETASGSTWLAASFGSGPTALSLTSATLLLRGSATNAVAQLSLYTDAGLVPGSLVATLTSPVTYSTSLASTIFASSGVTLTANSTYWIVLRAVTGRFDWAWTSNNSGTGVGFQHTWAVSDNAGSVWFSSDTFPTQFTITADTATVTAVPEPTGLSLLAGSLAVGLLARHRRQPSKGQTNVLTLEKL